MDISSVATGLRTALEPHIGHFTDIESTGTPAPNRSPDNSHRSEDELVDAMVADLFEDIQAIIQRHYQSELKKLSFLR